MWEIVNERIDALRVNSCIHNLILSLREELTKEMHNSVQLIDVSFHPAFWYHVGSYLLCLKMLYIKVFERTKWQHKLSPVLHNLLTNVSVYFTSGSLHVYQLHKMSLSLESWFQHQGAHNSYLLPQFIIVTNQPLSLCNDKTYLPHKEAGYCHAN